ncbi:MAG: hypothetical protein ACRCYQ_00270 [Nocardioides sp.]
MSTRNVSQLTPRSVRKKVAVSLAAVGVVAAGFAVPVVLNSSTGTGVGSGSDRVSVGPGNQAAGPVFTAEAIKVAEKAPRLVVGEDGWTIDDVNGFDGDGLTGTVGYFKDAATLEINWFPAKMRADYLDAQLDVDASPDSVTVAGLAGQSVESGGGRIEVILDADRDSFAMIDINGLPVAEAEAVLATIEATDVDTWLSTMPAQVVQPDGAEKALAEAIEGITLPPGFEEENVLDAGVNSEYHFGARVAGELTCGWVAEWRDARNANDQTAVDNAAAELAASRQWPFLVAMDEQGDFPELVWQIADEVGDGQDPVGAEGALGCEQLPAESGTNDGGAQTDDGGIQTDDELPAPPPPPSPTEQD